ncbi:M43 family zinc metalloprotease [Chitinophaga polysaccharea]|uniref:M43 family zinc metalloprotease n=1 Tax=Chitinophaga polysaccharea TaxID=1293035 RepID=UPI001158F4E8|nr:M43 family zinc metalloprotease [Chitinophaga polysaccharea]
MRPLIIFLILVSFCVPTAAQRKCGTYGALQQRIKNHPYLKQLLIDNENRILIGQRLHKFSSIAPEDRSLVTIPVVVHVVLDSPNIVTDEQIISQLEVLNRDFCATNTDTTQVPNVWKSIIGNAQIKFCLAQRTPDNKATNGILRIKTEAGKRFDIYGNDLKDDDKGGSTAWDSKSYLNIWVTSMSNNVIGLATPPGNGYPTEEEGVVIQYTAFGTTGSVKGPYNLGRTTTHEIGHYFGLRHTWADDDGGCIEDDGIDDTPLESNYTFGCPDFPKLDSCSPNPPGIMFMNYMDYTDDACMCLFTTLQVDRMRFVLESVIPGLLTSKGCMPLTPLNNDIALVSISSPSGKIYNSLVQPVIILRNNGPAPLTSAYITYTLNGGPPISQQWRGNLSSAQQITVNMPVTTVKIGTYDLKVYTQLPNGVPDSDPTNDSLSNHFHYDAEINIPFTEEFENSSFPPAGWDIYNPDQYYTWERNFSIGNRSSASAMVNNYDYQTYGQIDDLITPVINPMGAASVLLTFDVAAAATYALSAGSQKWDTLKILVIREGTTAEEVVYTKWGRQLITHAAVLSTPFIPTPADWRRDTVDLTNVVRGSKFYLRFRNISNLQNNIYIDNVSVADKENNTFMQDPGVNVSPNPTNGPVILTFNQNQDDLLQVSIYNSLGKLIISQPFNNNTNRSTNQAFDLTNQPDGAYFIKLNYRDKNRIIKLIKIR